MYEYLKLRKAKSTLSKRSNARGPIRSTSSTGFRHPIRHIARGHEEAHAG
jgi:hypothetical protein